jgi:hypothetical protein
MHATSDNCSKTAAPFCKERELVNPKILPNLTVTAIYVCSMIKLAYSAILKAKTNTSFISKASYRNYIPHFSNVINLDKKRFACFTLTTVSHHHNYSTRALQTAVMTRAANVTSFSLLGKSPQNQTNPVT